MVAAISDPVIR